MDPKTKKAIISNFDAKKVTTDIITNNNTKQINSQINKFLEQVVHNLNYKPTPNLKPIPYLPSYDYENNNSQIDKQFASVDTLIKSPSNPTNSNSKPLKNIVQTTIQPQQTRQLNQTQQATIQPQTQTTTNQPQPQTPTNQPQTQTPTNQPQTQTQTPTNQPQSQSQTQTQTPTNQSQPQTTKVDPTYKALNTQNSETRSRLDINNDDDVQLQNTNMLSDYKLEILKKKKRKVPVEDYIYSEIDIRLIVTILGIIFVCIIAYIYRKN